MTRHAVLRRGPATACALALAAGLGAPPIAQARAKLGDRLLHLGSHGRDVRALQSALTRLGHHTTADGRFGPATRRSVRGYERAEHLRRDGRVSRPQGRGIRRRVRALHPPSPAGPVATLSPDGRTAAAPGGAPPAVVAAIEAANAITDRPYRYGGGHGDFEDRAYDCSGAVSYVLHGAGLLGAPRPSTGLARFGLPGPGAWITVYANAGHAYVVVAGLRFDTSGRGEEGPRWRPEPRSGRAYTVRHPEGL